MPCKNFRFSAMQRFPVLGAKDQSLFIEVVPSDSTWAAKYCPCESLRQKLSPFLSEKMPGLEKSANYRQDKVRWMFF